jgi:integrase/recombinase XerD
MISQNTLAAYRNDLTQVCAYLERQQVRNWPEVTTEHIAAYLLEMRENQEYRPTTIARRLAALKTFFRYLRATEQLASDPLELLEPPRIPKDPPQVLTPEQVALLFQQVELSSQMGKRDMAMLHLLYATGLRVSELVELNIDDLRLEQATLVCPGRRGRNQRERTLPLLPMVIENCRAYTQDVRPQLAHRHPEMEALFLNHHGERLTRQGCWLIMKGYARQAGILDITPHKLRHSFAVLLLREGMELHLVQERLGHAHISSTQVYSQVAAQL